MYVCNPILTLSISFTYTHSEQQTLSFRLPVEDVLRPAADPLHCLRRLLAGPDDPSGRGERAVAGVGVEHEGGRAVADNEGVQP